MILEEVEFLHDGQAEHKQLAAADVQQQAAVPSTQPISCILNLLQRRNSVRLLFRKFIFVFLYIF